MMMVVMVTLMKNTILEKVKSAGALTDVDLYRSITKDGSVIPEDKFNKMLLDLEILGLVKVVWITKDERRIEASEDESGQDDAANGNGSDGGRPYGMNGAGGPSAGGGGSNAGRDEDTSYEASFPGLEK